MADSQASLSAQNVDRLAEEQRRAMPGASDVVIQLGVAAEVAMILLGPHVFHAIFGTSERHFASFDGRGGTGDFVYMQRVITLGKYLLECQSVQNFSAMRADMASRSLAGVCHEARCAALALRAGFSVSFVERTGVRGHDFDFLIDAYVALETKAKDEATAYSMGSLASTVNKARAQLPADGPGIVMMAVPDRWPEHPNFREDCETLAQELFRRSERVNALFFMWDQWVPVQPEGMACLRLFRRFEHPNPRTTGCDAVVAGLITKIEVERRLASGGHV